MKRLAKLAMEQAPVLAESPVYQGGEKQLVGSIAELVEKQARRLIELAPQLLDVDPDLL
jgi:serine/threonine-protein kinase HipA